MGKSEKDEEKNSREALLLERKKITYNLVLLLAASFVVLIGALTMAWFASNNRVDGTNMSVTVQGPNYVITTLDDGGNGLYYNGFHSLVIDDDAMIWQMNAENNMDNYIAPAEGQSEGIHPGSCGKILFYVTPKIATVNLDFEFEILGYEAFENETMHRTDMILLDQEEDPAIFLNGHILLFGSRTGTSSENYVYSDPILSGEDMKRVWQNQPFYGIGTATPVYIYWVWPKTLSKVVDARSCTKMHVTEAPFTNVSGSDYSALITNLVTYPSYYMKGLNEADNAEEEESSGNSLTISDIVTNYHIYGDYYDQADNDIGMEIDFVLLKMSASESASSNNGSGE